MSLTIREQIHAALATVLTDGLADVTVYRNRDAAVQKFPAVNLLDGAQDPVEPESTGIREYHLNPILELYVQTETDAELGPALNDLYGQVLTVLFGDRELGGLATDLEDGPFVPTMGRRENQRPVAGGELELLVKFCTAAINPYSQDPGE